MSRRVRIGIAVVAVAAVVIGLGRYEYASATRAQTDGMKRIFALVGPHWATSAAAYRLTPSFDCLLYRVGEDRFALELCFDPDGHVIEAVDRRSPTARFWTLQYEPGATTFAVDRAKLVAAFIAVGAAPKGSTSIPLGIADHGPILVPPKTPAGKG